MLVALLLAAQAAPAAGAGTAPAAQGAPAHELRVDLKFDAAFLKAADRDGNGALSQAEFTAALDARMSQAIAASPAAAARIGAPERAKMDEMIAQLFRGLDVNSDGQITLAELTAFGRSAASAPPPASAALAASAPPAGGAR